MEIKKFNNFVLENKEEVTEEPKKGKCKDCGKKFKKCKCKLDEKMSKAEFLEMIGKGKKGKKGKKDKSCKKCEK